MNRKISAVLLIVLLTAGGNLLAAKQKKTGDLSPRYRQWLDVVNYIITKDEKITFFKLTHDRDREIFISLFWNLRDPSPDTDRNEFKEEHMRRFMYANKYFGYGTPRKGWQTDMGQVYIILGEPVSTDKYDVDSIVVPTQVWNYYGKKRPGLPSAFRIVFWKKDIVGEFKLYDPAGDGPFSLLRQTMDTSNLDPVNIEASYEMILNNHPELAPASLSLLPDDPGADFTPSLRSQQLLQQVMTHPVKQINDTYATNFLKYKGKVDVDYSLNYIESKHQVVVIRDPETGLDFVHFAVRPQRVSAESDEANNRYSFTFDLMVSLTPAPNVQKGTGRKIIKGAVPLFEYRKHFPFSGDRETFVKNFANSVIVSDCLPVAEGDYRLSVMLQNRVNKEFTYFDADVSVKPSNFPGPVVNGVMVSKEVKADRRPVFSPFKSGNLAVLPAPGGVTGVKDDLYVVFNLERRGYAAAMTAEITVRDFFDPMKYEKQYSLAVPAGEGSETFSLKPAAVNPGYYRVLLRLTAADGEVLAETEGKFTAAAAERVAGTSNISRTVSHENRFLYFHILGRQYLQLNRLDKAETYLAKAFNARPQYPPFIKDYASLLLREKRFDKVPPLVEPLLGLETFRFDYYALKGKALFGQEKYKEAADLLARANRIYDSDVSVLNALGLAYLKLGNKAEAKKVLSASLRLNENQPQIAALLEELN